MRKPTRSRPLLAHVGSYTTPERHGDGDGIDVYRVDRAKGTLAPRQWVPTHGRTPGFFAFDPDQRFPCVANRDSRSIVGYRADREGRLAPARIRVRVGSPPGIVFSPA